jgi:hypothetical protein
MTGIEPVPQTGIELGPNDLAEGGTRNRPMQLLGFIRGLSHQRDTEEPDRVAPCF